MTAVGLLCSSETDVLFLLFSLTDLLHIKHDVFVLEALGAFQLSLCESEDELMNSITHRTH